MSHPVMINSSEELIKARLGSLHARPGTLMSLLTFFDGYDTFNPSMSSIT